MTRQWTRVILLRSMGGLAADVEDRRGHARAAYPLARGMASHPRPGKFGGRGKAQGKGRGKGPERAPPTQVIDGSRADEGGSHGERGSMHVGAPLEANPANQGEPDHPTMRRGPLLMQKQKDKNKLSALHAPEVGARSMPGNPYEASDDRNQARSPDLSNTPW